MCIYFVIYIYIERERKGLSICLWKDPQQDICPKDNTQRGRRGHKLHHMPGFQSPVQPYQAFYGALPNSMMRSKLTMM